MHRPLAIRTRLTLWYGGVLAATIVALGAMVWLSAAAILRASLDEALRVQAADVRAGIERPTPVAITRLDPGQPGIFTAIFGPRGDVRIHSPGLPAALRQPPLGTTTAQVPGSESSFALLAESAPDGETIVVGSSLAAVDRNLTSLTLILVGIGAGGFLASLAGGWLLSGRALGPVERLTSEASEIGAGDLDRRLPDPARLDEIGRLARTLNSMLDRVAESVRRERAFVSAASHDLRTPIAALRTELELAERAPDDPDAMHAAVRLAHADAVRLSNLAADLLGLAEAEASGRTIARQPVAVRQLVEGAITRVLPLAAERSIAIELDAAEGVVEVDRVRLEQALVNLLANAIRESPVGSSVQVETRLEVPDQDRTGHDHDTTPGTLDIAVLDRGPGVAVDVRQVLFVPFASRARGRSDGTGLGLATAAAAVRAHHGAIGHADRPGGGSVFRIRVPTNAFGIGPAARSPGARPRLASASGGGSR